MSKRGRPPEPDILTPREWEVLALLRRGLSNREIAEELEISLAGAKFHVSEIISKLGVSSREEAATWRTRRGLPALLPLPFIRWPTFLRKAVVGVIDASTALLICGALFVVLSRHGDGRAVVTRTQQWQYTPTPVPEVKPGQIGPVSSYFLAGGYFLNASSSSITLQTVPSNAVVDYPVDGQAQYYWAGNGELHQGRAAPELITGESVTLGYSSDVPQRNDITRISAIYVVIGYFKYMDGEVVSTGSNYVDVRLNPQINFGGLAIRDGILRVWVDPEAVTDLPAGSHFGPGSHVGFSGLIDAYGEPVASSLY